MILPQFCLMGVSLPARVLSAIRLCVGVGLLVCVAIVVAAPQVDIEPTVLWTRHWDSGSPVHVSGLALMLLLGLPVLTPQLVLISLREEPFQPSLPVRLSTVCERRC